ncbi:uncharacterized protein LOC121917995, partial [Sceloporus undulatus]|uniref:uncharacterized protein LOC121917995 n=1 Tax=Sceloporus undulatus TaxID=8520 RepID=UPI001C4B4DE9
MQPAAPAPPTLVENAGTAPRAGPRPSQEQLFTWFAEQQQLMLQHLSSQQTRVLEQVCAAQQNAQAQLLTQLTNLWRAPRTAEGEERGLTWTVGLNPLKLMKMGPQDDVEAFLNTFERVAAAAQWPREQWALILTPCLTGPAQEAVDTLSPEDAQDYAKVKATILQTLNISEDTYRLRLRELKWRSGMHPRTLGQKIRASALRWLKPMERSALEVAELVMVEQFVASLPTQARNWVRCHRPKDLERAVTLMEAFTTAEEAEAAKPRRGAEGIAIRGGKIGVGPGRFGGREGHGPTRPKEEAVAAKPEAAGKNGEEAGPKDLPRKAVICYTCGMEGHIRRDCPVMECSWGDTWDATQAWRVREALWTEVEDDPEEREEWFIGPQTEDFIQTGEVPIMSPLTGPQQEQVRVLQQQFGDVFRGKPGQTSLIQHAIVTEPATVVRMPIRPWPWRVQKAINDEVETMLQLGVIEPSKSPWRSSPVMVPKPDGSIRFCIDFRQVNKVSKFDAYPMPGAINLLERLGQARFLSSLDLTKGYWQIELRPEDREKTAFATPKGLFQFTRMPFGLHGAAATFQRLMDRVLQGLEFCAAAYIDDIIIFSDSWEEHIEHLTKVLGALRAAGLTANPKKCAIACRQVKYLGHAVGQGLIKPLMEKVVKVQDWGVPQTKKQVRQFLGLEGYYRRFIPHFAHWAAPLTDLTKKGQPRRVRWGRREQLAFDRLKDYLYSYPVLRAPDFSRPFILQTDASEVGLGAVLSQMWDDGEHPVLYLSKKLKKAEQRYAAIEREAL